MSRARLGIVLLRCGSHAQQYSPASEQHHSSASSYYPALHPASHALTAAGAYSATTRIRAAIHSHNRYRNPGLLHVLARMAAPR